MNSIAFRHDHYNQCPFNLQIECPECFNSEQNIIDHLIVNHGYKETIMSAAGGVQSFSGTYKQWNGDTDWPKEIWRFGNKSIIVRAKSLNGVFHVYLFKVTRQAIRLCLTVQNNQYSITYKGLVPHIKEYQEHCQAFMRFNCDVHALQNHFVRVHDDRDIFKLQVNIKKSLIQPRQLKQQQKQSDDIQEKRKLRQKLQELYTQKRPFEKQSKVILNGLKEINQSVIQQVDRAKFEKQQFEVQQRLQEQDTRNQQIKVQLNAHQPEIKIKTISSKDKYGIYEYDGIQLQKVATLPYQIDRWPACVMLEDGSLFICGGLDQELTLILSPENQVREIPKMNQISSISAIVQVEQRIYVFGGYTYQMDAHVWYLDEASYFDLRQNRWVDIQKLPNKRSGCGAAYYNGFIYVGGGKRQDENNNNEILKYEIESDDYFPTNMTFADKVSTNGSSLFVVQNSLYCLKGIEMRVYNLDSEELLNTFPIPEYSWWSNFPPVVIGDEAYLGSTWDEKLRKVNFITGVVTEIGNLEE